MTTVNPSPPAVRPGRYRQVVLILILAVLVIGGLIAFRPRTEGPDANEEFIRKSLAEVMPEDPNLNGTKPIGDSEPAFWTDLAIYRPDDAGTGGESASKSRPRPLVAFGEARGPHERVPELYYGPIGLELIRQGFLLSAREELGATTRDLALGDAGPARTPTASARLGIRTSLSLNRLCVARGKGIERRNLWAREFQLLEGDAQPTFLDFPGLIRAVEEMTRSDFRTAWELAGLPPGPPAVEKDDGSVPAGVEERLGRLIETEQFAAIRAIHDANRRGGESPERLAMLSHAYATLGSLADGHWNRDHAAYKARALLYAQRLFVREQGSARARWARGYAYAMAGLFREALADLDAAASGANGPPPAWADAIRAYCLVDGSALEALAKARPTDPFPLYLRVFTLASRHGSSDSVPAHCGTEIAAACENLLRLVPECYRVRVERVRAGGLGIMHVATLDGPQLFGEAMPRRIAAIPGLPEGVAKRVADGIWDEVASERALDSASNDDPIEPTWGTLARMVREIRFVQVAQRITFLRNALATDCSEFAASALPYVADHPHRAFVAAHAAPLGSPEHVRLMKSLHLEGVETKAFDLISPVRHVDDPTFQRLNALSFATAEAETVPGAMDRLQRVIATERPKLARHLLGLVPGSPLGRAALIISDWESVRGEAEKWAEDHGGGDTPVIGRLGVKYAELGRTAEAEQLLTRAMARSPEAWMFQGLSSAYARSGELERWSKALDAFLKTPDAGLAHARARVDFADALMARGEYARARPYAQKAAETWAAWAMLSAVRCEEGLKNWSDAELWVSRLSERYSSHGFNWFHWCKRTGHGDDRAAAALIEAHIKAQGGPGSETEAANLAAVLLLTDRSKPARQLFDGLFAATKDVYFGVWAADLADADGDTVRRDEVLRQISSRSDTPSPRTAKLAGDLVAWLSKGDAAPLELEPIRTSLEGMDPTSRATTSLWVGRFLDRHGKRDLALDYLKAGARVESAPWPRVIALSMLRARGIDPGDLALP